jgi:hypothetical protein
MIIIGLVWLNLLTMHLTSNVSCEPHIKYNCKLTGEKEMAISIRKPNKPKPKKSKSTSKSGEHKKYARTK